MYEQKINQTLLKIYYKIIYGCNARKSQVHTWHFLALHRNVLAPPSIFHQRTFPKLSYKQQSYSPERNAKLKREMNHSVKQYNCRFELNLHYTVVKNCSQFQWPDYSEVEEIRGSQKPILELVLHEKCLYKRHEKYSENSIMTVFFSKQVKKNRLDCTASVNIFQITVIHFCRTPEDKAMSICVLPQSLIF